MRGVMPKPEAEFSPLAMTRSILALLDDVGQAVTDDLPTGRTDDVADKKNAHEAGERSFWLMCTKRSGLLSRGELGREPLK